MRKTRLLTSIIMAISLIVGLSSAPVLANTHFSEMASRGNYTYCLDGGHGLKVVDISNPAMPKETATFALKALPIGLDVAGKYAYLACFNQGLIIIDVSNPKKLREVGKFACDEPVEGVIVSGNYAYLKVGGNKLYIVSLALPSLEKIGEYEFPDYGCITDAVVVGQKMFAGLNYRGLYIVDTAEPKSPRLIGACNFDGCVTSIAVTENRAYITTGVTGLLRIIDLTDLGQPKLIESKKIGNYPAMVNVMDKSVVVTSKSLEPGGNGSIEIFTQDDFQASPAKASLSIQIPTFNELIVASLAPVMVITSRKGVVEVF